MLPGCLRCITAAQSGLRVAPPRQLTWSRRPPAAVARRTIRACAAPSGRESAAALDELLTYDFGVINRGKRAALLRTRVIASSPSAASLAAQLRTLCALLGTTDDDFSLCLCASEPGEVGALLELGAREVSARMAGLRVALPPGADAAKVVAAAPGLLLQPDVCARVRGALEALRVEAPWADQSALAKERPGSFGELLEQLCDSGGDASALSPFLHAWFQGLPRGDA
jgi:hypothetical protein